jgi:hypothetical protein
MALKMHLMEVGKDLTEVRKWSLVVQAPIHQNWDREDEENARNNHRKMDPNLIMRKVVLRSGK